MTTVIQHRQRQAAELAGTYVYIGRPSKWGNPFTMRDHSGYERARVVQSFRKYWYAVEQTQLRAAAIVELSNKVLGCFCSPLMCHGDVIATYVNGWHALPASMDDV